MFERLNEDIATILERDPAARSRWEVVTCYPGLHALLFHRWSNLCWSRGYTWAARWISHWGRLLTGIEIHPGATIGRRVFIDHGMGVVIGETAVIGDECTIYQGVTLGGTSLSGGKRHPTLERGVVVGAGAKILGPFIIGAGARVGSNAVVVKEVPPGATAVGIPARIILETDAQQREEKAARMGFSAYAVTQNADDPLSIALHSLIDHTARQGRQIEAMMAALDKLGACPETDIDDENFDPKKLNDLLD